ncbi:MAG: stress responsive protein [Mesorhizobium amorphae]|nr:MAG: stress responsive protein [Mesorhizobium amorphae]
MIRHCVFIRFRSDVSRAERDNVLAGIAALQSTITGIEAIHLGQNASPEGMDRGFSEGFTVDFSDEAARDGYLTDAGHAAAGKRIVDAAEGGIDGILVFDLAI